MVAKHVNEKNVGKPRVLAINVFLHSLFLALYCCLWYWRKATAAIVNFARIWCVRNSTRLGLETFTWQNLTPAERVTRSCRPGYPPWRVTHLSCKRATWSIKMRDNMDRRVTSPTWGPPPPRKRVKQALRACLHELSLFKSGNTTKCTLGLACS